MPEFISGYDRHWDLQKDKIFKKLLEVFECIQIMRKIGNNFSGKIKLCILISKGHKHCFKLLKISSGLTSSDFVGIYKSFNFIVI